MTPKEKQFNKFYEELKKYISLRENRHDIETIDFVAKSFLYLLGVREVKKIMLIIY